MVVGPLMQGVVLAGIIYWYSKGMMSMINDYYRSEFHRKLRDVNETATEVTTYDLDNFENLLNVEENILKKTNDAKDDHEAALIDDCLIMHNDFDLNNNRKCYAPTALDLFFYIIGLNISKEALKCLPFKESILEYKIS